MTERDDAPLPVVDRLLAAIGFRLHNLLRRRLAESAAAPPTRGDVSLSGLRYQLRRNGFRRETVATAIGVYASAMTAPPAARVVAAAQRLVEGGVVELADGGERAHALGMAALVRVIAGERVHLLAEGAEAARALAEAVRPPLRALGVGVEALAPQLDAAARRRAYAVPILCGALREVGLDYLRDTIQGGGRPGALRAALERISADPHGDATAALNPGLECALVAQADAVMLDDAIQPLVIGTEADTSGERLLYDQAMELARGLSPGEHFVLEGDAIRLTEQALHSIERLLAPLGGVWALPERRETLVVRALRALHALRAGVDYRVEGGRVLFPQPAAEGEDQPDEAAEEVKRLVEVKEGCRLSARRVILGRISVPRFLRRYAHLGGVCADARGLEGELWTLYGLKTSQAGRRRSASTVTIRVFLTAQGKEDAKQAANAAGRPVIAELPRSRQELARLCEAKGAEACEVLLSLEDEALAARPGLRSSDVRAAGQRGELSARAAQRIAARALRAAERAQRAMRRELAARERVLDDLLAFSGRHE